MVPTFSPTSDRRVAGALSPPSAARSRTISSSVFAGGGAVGAGAEDDDYGAAAVRIKKAIAQTRSVGQSHQTNV